MEVLEVLNKLIALIFISMISFNPECVAAAGQGAVTSAGEGQAAAVMPIVKRDSLLNGLQLIVLEEEGTGSVSARLRINSGALFDLAGKGGLADATAGMLLKGGGGFDSKAVTDTVQQLGLTINISVDWDATDILISGPSDSLDAIFDLLSRIVIDPKFDQKEFDAFKAGRIAALNEDEKSDSEAVRRKALDIVFGTHPFGRPMRGSADSVSKIKREDLIYYHKRFYLANNAELIISGDATAEQVTRLGRSKLGAWKKGEKVPATFRPPAAHSSRQAVILDRPDSSTARVAISQVGISRRAEDYFSAAVMGAALDQINSKAVSAGATAVRTRLDARFLPGPLVVEFESSPDDLAAAIDAVLAGMTQFQSSRLLLEQVEAAKSRVISSFQERLRTSEGTSGLLLDIELYGLGRDYMINFVNRVNGVTPEDVQQAARAYLKPESVVVVVAGPAGRIETVLKKNASVKVLP